MTIETDLKSIKAALRLILIDKMNEELIEVDCDVSNRNYWKDSELKCATDNVKKKYKLIIEGLK